MRVTVCEMHDSAEAFARDWAQLVGHVRDERSELVVLPEMPFHPWFAATRPYDPEVWSAAVAAHDAWEERLHELGRAIVVATRPVDFGNDRFTEGYVWTAEGGLQSAHTKAYLPDEPGAWEASWYEASPAAEFTPLEVGDVRIGLLICSELWAMRHAQDYAGSVDLIATPRATERRTLEKWLAAGRTAAILAGAFGLSSNRVDETGVFGGQGWIIDPDGEVLALSSDDQPIVTREIDLLKVQGAQRTYPRYVLRTAPRSGPPLP